MSTRLIFSVFIDNDGWEAECTNAAIVSQGTLEEDIHEKLADAVKTQSDGPRPFAVLLRKGSRYDPRCPFQVGDRVRFERGSAAVDERCGKYLLLPPRGTEGTVIAPPDMTISVVSKLPHLYYVWVAFPGDRIEEQLLMISDNLEKSPPPNAPDQQPEGSAACDS